MSSLHPIGLGNRLDGPLESGRIEHVLTQRPLRRVLAFTGRSIDDVVNCPVAKRQVAGYFKLHCWVEGASEVSDLERQWNDVPL